MAVNKSSLIKFLELIICIACLALHYKASSGDFTTDLVSGVAFGGYLIILAGGYTGQLLSTPGARKIDVFYCLVGCAVFLGAGALNIKYFDDAWKGERRNYGLAKGGLALVNGALFLVDTLFTWRGEY